jgi:hypothetical protein
MWLCFESLLSYIVPLQKNAKGKITEKERDWLFRALRKINKKHHLSEVFRVKRINFKQIVKELYTDTRLELFHSKAGRATLLPHQWAPRNIVSDALQKLTRIVLFLAEHWLNVTRLNSGVLTYAGFEGMARPFLDGARVLVSSDISPLNSEETLEHPAYQAAIRIPTRLAPELSAPGLMTILGNVAVGKLHTLSQVARVGVEHSGSLNIVEVLEAPLTLEGIDCFQAQIGIRLINSGLPQYSFRS